MQPDQRFCPSCGASQDPVGSASSEASTDRLGGERTRKSKSRLVLAVVIALALGGSAAGVILATSGGDQKSAATETFNAAAESQRENQAKYDRCKKTMGPFLDKLHELDSRLDVGLNYDEYTTKVGDARVAYDEATSSSSSQAECLAAVGLPAEAALNQYVKASTAWGKCFEDVDCDARGST